MPLDYSANLRVFDRLKNDIAFSARRNVFDLFMRECAPSAADRVADFGVSGHRDHPVHFFFEVLFPYKQNLTAIGRQAEDAEWYPEQFPGLTFVQADLREIPIEDDYFDVGICNAVVEHAGTRDQQVALVREVCRVSRRVLFTTPNKGFPVELHTFLPFVHWLPDHAFRSVLRRLGYTRFSSVEDLNPLGTDDFFSLFPGHRENRLIRLGFRALPTNLACISSIKDGFAGT